MGIVLANVGRGQLTVERAVQISAHRVRLCRSIFDWTVELLKKMIIESIIYYIRRECSILPILVIRAPGGPRLPSCGEFTPSHMCLKRAS